MTELILSDSGAGLGTSATTPRLSRRSVSASVEYRVDKTWTFGGALGATVSGELDLGDRSHRLDPGWIVVVSASRTLANMAPFFVVMGMSLGVSSGATRSVGGGSDGQLTAGDVRLGFTAGRLIADTLAPYAALRLFGGPILWQRDGQPLAGGTDRYHVQAGLGLLVSATTGVDAFVEVAPVGERAITVGAGFGF